MHPLAELRRYDVTRPPWLYVNNGASEMELHPHDNSAVVRWILRRKGIALIGPPAASLVDELPAGSLAAETRETLVEWHAYVEGEPDALDNAWEQTHAVTQHCRFLFAVVNDAVATKPQAVAWAIDPGRSAVARPARAGVGRPRLSVGTLWPDNRSRSSPTHAGIHGIGPATGRRHLIRRSSATPPRLRLHAAA